MVKDYLHVFFKFSTHSNFCKHFFDNCTVFKPRLSETHHSQSRIRSVSPIYSVESSKRNFYLNEIKNLYRCIQWSLWQRLISEHRDDMAVQGTELEWGDILVIIGYFVVVIAVGILVSTCLHVVPLTVGGGLNLHKFISYLFTINSDVDNLRHLSCFIFYLFLIYILINV